MTDRLEALRHQQSVMGSQVINVLKINSFIKLTLESRVGGADDLTLLQHTQNVIDAYELYFENFSSSFFTPVEFKILLAVHDLGKPRAIAEDRPQMQHSYTADIIDNMLGGRANNFWQKVKIMVCNDPIGRHLNKKYDISLDDTVNLIEKMSELIEIKVNNLWDTLLIYYQCDVLGYPSLRKKVFRFDSNSQPIFSGYILNLIFRCGDEQRKFDILESRIKNLF